MIGPVHVVLFDLGNTLFFDNAAAWPRVYARAEGALWHVLRSSGVSAAPATVYGKPDTLLGHYYALRGMGEREPGTYQVLRDLLALHAPGTSEGALRRALRAMYSITQTNWKVERGAALTLRTLQKRGFRVGAVSNGSDDWNALQLLDRARLRPYFELVLTSAAHGWRKPHPRIFQAALEHFDVEPGLAVMIGDSYDADILGASALGIRTIWLTRRAHTTTVAKTVEPDAIVPDLVKVPGMLAKA